MRVFIAIPFPDSIKQKLQQVQDRLKDLGADVRWAKVEQLHGTLSFLGEVDRRRVSEVHQGLEGAVLGVPPFSIEVRGIGVFPSWRRPRVLWIGLDGGEALIDLHERVANALEEIGYPKENRRFRPHATLGRFRSSRNVGPLVELLHRIEQECYGRFKVDHITLFDSRLRPEGPLHHEIAHFSF